jgi:HAD superfamily hydrolase (TIGR01509 family)
MTKLFLFDFDGVVIDNESTWEKIEASMYKKVFEPDVYRSLGLTIGLSIDGIHDKAVACGSKVDKDVLIKEYNNKAPNVYKNAPLTPGIDTIGETLEALGYKIGIVSASSRAWIDIALNRTSFKNDVEFILSLFDRKDLAHKPAPDGYQEAMRFFGISPENTVILEDSNTGIEAAKSSGAHTIRFTQNLVEGYVQSEADSTADNLDAVIDFLESMQS